ncbi:MAG: exodeoxyribonuclease VII large subunit [Veillonellaceae bacterium]|nr:exodeoxyribonuclease VII large subunit [Veillonellaceae bacterium]
MQIQRVKELTSYLEQKLNTDYALQQLMVAGTVTSVSRSARGTVFFTLSDEDARLACVVFPRQARLLAGALQPNAEIVVRGNIAYSGKYGSLQMAVQGIKALGTGLRAAALEALRRELETEGYFAPERKRPLPRYPFRVGLVTSVAGAVIHDVQSRLHRRNPLVSLAVYPCSVQGTSAAEDIARAVREANEDPQPADVLIIARGGGAQDDLAPYSERAVLDAAFGSKIPVISAIGHESDSPLLDLVADMRASTPTHAAELVAPPAAEIYADLANYHTRLFAAAERLTLGRWRQAARRFAAAEKARLPLLLVETAHWHEQAAGRLTVAYERMQRRAEENITAAAQSLQAVHPETVFRSGYFWLEAKRRRVRNLTELAAGDTLLITDNRTRVRAKVEAVET